MKLYIWKKLAIVLLSFTYFACQKSDNLTLKDLESKAINPDWLTEEFVEMDDDTKWGPYQEGRKEYQKLKESLNQYLYLVNKGSDQDYYPYWLLTMGTNLLRLDEDHLAYEYLKKLINLDSQTSYNIEWERYPTLESLKRFPMVLVIRIFAKNGLKDETLQAIDQFDPQDNNEYYSIAQSFMLIGESDKAMEYLFKAVDPSIYDRLHKRSSTTAGAVSLAYNMGKYDEINLLSQWMNELGKDVSDENYMKYDEEGNKSEYFVNQWQSSYDLVQQYQRYAKLALSGKILDPNNLSPGEYKGTSRGFLDEIEIDLSMEEDRISAINVFKSEDDRPYSALKIIPNRIIEKQNLQIDTITQATITSVAIMAASLDAVENSLQ